MVLGYKPLVVLSGSMEPTYEVGSVIYHKKVDEEKLRVGDVITFTYDKEPFITHRIVSIKNGYFETKGDANNIADYKKIEYKNIQGKVAKFYLPVLGYYVNFVNNHLYYVGVIIIILVSEFLLGSVKTIDIDKRKGKEVKTNEKNKQKQKQKNANRRNRSTSYHRNRRRNNRLSNIQ